MYVFACGYSFLMNLLLSDCWTMLHRFLDIKWAMSDYKVIFLNDLAIALRSDAELTVVNRYLRYLSTISSDNSDESRSIMD